MWNKFIVWFLKDKPSHLVIPSKPYRKSSDTTKLTQGMYDFVIEMKAAQEDHNDFYTNKEHAYETTEELCDYLNMVFNTNFGRSKLTRIWTGKVNRKDLPEGIKYEVPF